MRPALILAVAGAVAASPAATLAQRSWNDSTTRQLVARATDRRARQLADSGLADYTAQAHGYLTFLGQVGDSFLLPPKVIKADELMLEVHWRAPNYSKQWIVGRRDTLLLPTDINYHRDHLGIVQNNFPDIIRLGEGDEVQDVAHPLSARGLATYEYQLSDSMRLEIPGRTIDVYEVKVRPRDDREAAAVGAVYIAKDDGQVVRMAFSFTRSALKDKLLEDVSIVIENSLIEGRYWLPSRQEIEIRRTGSWMDFPARGIIRGRWEIRDYRVNQGSTVALAPGPEIVYAPPQRRAGFRWADTTIMAGLPSDIDVARDDDVRQVQEEARRLVRAQALQRAQSTRPSARSLSDLLQVNRAEGLALGAGVQRRFGAGFDANVAGRFGFADHEPKGSVSLGWERADGVALRLRAFREYRDAGDARETSRLRNSIAAQEFGSDYSQPFDTRGAGVAFQIGTHGGLRWRLDGGYEWQDGVAVRATPSLGAYEPTLAAFRGKGAVFSLGAERPLGEWWWGGTLRARGELRVGQLGARGDPALGVAVPPVDPSVGAPLDRSGGFMRGFASLDFTRDLGRSQLQLRAEGGGVHAQGGVAPQLLLFAGGPTSAPGYDFHAFRSTTLFATHAEWRMPVPFPGIPLGRWGRIPGEARLAPSLHLLYTGSGAPGTLRGAPGGSPVGSGYRSGWYPAVGLGALSFFDLLRVDVARGLRDGRWTFGVDISRDFWSIL